MEELCVHRVSHRRQKPAFNRKLPVTYHAASWLIVDFFEIPTDGRLTGRVKNAEQFLPLKHTQQLSGEELTRLFHSTQGTLQN